MYKKKKEGKTGQHVTQRDNQEDSHWNEKHRTKRLNALSQSTYLLFSPISRSTRVFGRPLTLFKSF
jgi:hypothetical protein